MKLGTQRLTINIGRTWRTWLVDAGTQLFGNSLLALSLAFLTACPDDGNADSGAPATETDDPGAGDAGVPGDGEPAIPEDQGTAPEDPGDHSDQIVNPWAIGNGLVMDTRMLVDATEEAAGLNPGDLGDAASIGHSWNDLPTYATMRNNGFRVSRIIGAATANTALPPEPFYQLEGTRQALWIADGEASSAVDVRSYTFSDPAAETAWAASPAKPNARQHPYDIDCGATGASGSRRPAVAWAFEDGRLEETTILSGVSSTDLATEINETQYSGFRPIAIDNIEDWDSSEGVRHCAVFVKDTVIPANGWAFTQDLMGRDALIHDVADQWGAGFFPMDVGAARDGSGQVWFDVIYYRVLPKQSVQMQMNLTTEALLELDQTYRAQGYHATVLEPMDESSDNWLAVWNRFDAYVRTTDGSTPLNPTDTQAEVKQRLDEIARDLLFGDLRQTDSVASQFDRHLATLHVMEDGVITVDRGYAFAPAIHPGAPLGGINGLGSVAKSVAAIAVAIALQESGGDYSDTLDGIFSWSTRPEVEFPSDPDEAATLRAVTVDAVMKNRGGFLSYGVGGHESVVSTADDLGLELEYPLDVRSVRSVAERRLGQPDVWNPLLASQATFAYSNGGWNLLAGVVEELSGVATVEEFVQDRLIAPLGLELRESVRSQSRMLTDDFDRARIGAQLIDPKHPYRDPTVAPEDVIEPLHGTDPLPGQWSLSTVNGDPESNTVSVPEMFGGAHTLKANYTSGGMSMTGADALTLLREVVLDDGTLAPAGTFTPLFAASGQGNGFNTAWSSSRYERGFYVRGNWIWMLGGDAAALAAVAYNKQYDFGFAIVGNPRGNPQGDIASNFCDNSGDLPETAFPCADDPSTTTYDECQFGQWAPSPFDACG